MTTPVAWPTLDVLTRDPHPALASIRSTAPLAWVDSLGGWLVVGHATAVRVMRDAGTFTVDDPRFSTSRVVGPSMLSTDGAEHDRHRQPFVSPFTPRSTRAHFVDFVDAEAARLVAAVAPAGEAEIRTAIAGPLAAACMQRALGLEAIDVGQLLTWYTDIVAAVAAVTSGSGVPEGSRLAYAALTDAVRSTIATAGASSFLGEVAATAGTLTSTELLSDIAVLLFGGIETTEGMITNLVLHLLREGFDPAALLHENDLLDAAIEESLRLEPAAAVVDRYATRDSEIAGVRIRRGELVVVSLAGANRDPAVFEHPDRFDPARPNLRKQLAFAQGPHVCLGAHLARLETRTAARALLALPGVRLDPARTVQPSGLVFRKSAAVWVRWDRTLP
jgi:cytochrome P450